MANRLDIIREQLEQELNSFRSINVKISQTFTNPGAGEDPMQYASAIYKIDYTETSLGERRFVHESLPKGRPSLLSIDTTDGKTASLMIRRPDGNARETVTIQRHFGNEDQLGWSHRPIPLFYFSVGRRPLAEAVGEAEILGDERVIDRDCDALLFKDVDCSPAPCDFVYLLDKATSIPLKVSCYLSRQDRLNDAPRSVWTADSLDEVQGRHVPLKSSVEAYVGGGSGKIAYRSDIVVESVKYNEEYPAQHFQPNITKSTNVIDTIKNEYKMGEPPEPVLHSSATIPENAIRAVDPADWSSFVVPSLLVLGVSLLLAAVATRIRSSRPSNG